jgi:hypothetical protein
MILDLWSVISHKSKITPSRYCWMPGNATVALVGVTRRRQRIARKALSVSAC